MPTFENTPEVIRINAFLNKIGISVISKNLSDDTFLPGLELGPNCIYIDYEKLLYPGDILHEAGHVAVTTAENRKLIGSADMPENWPSQGDEMSAIIWSCAAAEELGLPLEFVFHPNGYKGSSDWLIENYRSKTYTGLNLLEWFGMALSEKRAVQENKAAFPVMQQWLRD